MTYRHMLLSALFAALSCNLFAAVFFVTSNADAGPGTFRQALIDAAANGSAEKDYINFNIADVSEAGRTIIVLSTLPDVSSNIVIDGSTQPGNPFGVSEAKVALLFDSKSQAGFHGLNITNQADIEIYGLYLKLTNLFKRYDNPVGIQIRQTDNVQLGGVGKGNVIAGFNSPFAVNNDNVSQSTGLVVKSNFLSIQADGLTVTDDFAPNIINVSGNITIGGVTGAEGNLLAKGIQMLLDTANGRQTTVLFQHNKSGVNYNLTAAFPLAIVEINGPRGTSITNSVVNIEDNIITSDGTSSLGIFIGSVGGIANIVRNNIGVDDNQNKIGTLYVGIYVQLCKEVFIGSEDVNDANYIGFSWPVFGETTGNLDISKNSFFCTVKNYIYFDDPPGVVRTQCNTTSITPTAVAGTATPNAEIQLYYTDKCGTCSPQYYLASTRADANGNWVYNGDIKGTVIANATLNNSSSEFTFTRIDTKNLIVADACGGYGSITGISVFGATSIIWIDDKRNVVGNTAELLNIKPGKYKLLVSNGGCADSTAYYTINPKFTLDTSNTVVTRPACADSLGSVTGLKITNNDKSQISYSWTNAAGKVLSDSLTLKNVPAGTYTFVAKGNDNCIQTYGPLIMDDQTSVFLPPSADNVKLCSTGDGFIRVNNPLAGNTYRLYDSETASTPLDEEKNGVFKVTVTQNTTYYVSRVFYSCESTRVPVVVAVGLTVPVITNSFTPNGDGINDYWVIPGIETFPAAKVRVFNRYGQVVFESNAYANTFDGTENGKQLPPGVYYYIINLTSYCKIMTGSLTIIR